LSPKAWLVRMFDQSQQPITVTIDFEYVGLTIPSQSLTNTSLRKNKFIGERKRHGMKCYRVNEEKVYKAMSEIFETVHNPPARYHFT
jgi:hypothetical protein